MILMAPRRNHNTSNIVTQQPNQQQQQLQPQLSTTSSSSSSSGVIYNHNYFLSPEDSNSSNMPMQTSITNTNSNLSTNHNKSGGDQFVRCCYPNGDCFKSDLINLEDLSECIKVICNNENCNVGQYMHRECFESWEQTVLQTLKTMGGRARSWSDRQKAQNLWTKKGYDLVYKVCGCKCSRGHLRKDLEWVAPKAGQLLNGQRIMNGVNTNGSANPEDEDKKKKKNKRNRQQQQQQQNNKTLAPMQTNGHTNGQQQQQQQTNGSANTSPEPMQMKQELSLNNSSTNNLNNPPPQNQNVGVIGSGLHQNSPAQQQQPQNQQQNLQQNSSSDLPQNVVTSLNNLLNGQNNILGLDLLPRTDSISSNSNNSGSTSPSVISFTTGELSLVGNNVAGPTSMTSLQNLNLNGFYHPSQNVNQQQQQLHTNLLQQSSVNAASLTKNILNGLQSSGLLGNSTTSNNLINGINTNSSVAAATALLIKQQQQQQQCATILTNGNGLKHPLTPFEQQQLLLLQKVKEVELYSERVRSTSGCNGIFSRRLDFSSFNLLPKTRLNSYQVKIEDEGNHGNDETRLFILSSLAQSQKSRVACILCEEPMLVFDRYPLVDGSFFLSPKQHSTDCIEVKYEGRSLFLTSVCMRCLDGTSTNRNISCRFCADKWDGSNLVLGTMYAYDIFAAMPCCAERLKCNNCFKLLLHPQQRLNFYSDYSHCVTCPYCATQDTHFVKPLTYCYAKSLPRSLTAIA